MSEKAAIVSIPSPSGLLQNGPNTDMRSMLAFQSLLLQVSFKTCRAKRTSGMEVSIPSPSGLLQNEGRKKCLNGS